jgi:hypothetical protein
MQVGSRELVCWGILLPISIKLISFLGQFLLTSNEGDF